MTDLAPVDGLLLTDDEVVTVAVCAGRPWPTVLPTVDIDDADALMNAVARGRRSLAVRGLLENAGGGVGKLVDDLRDLIGDSLEDELSYMVFVSDEAVQPVDGPLHYYFGRPDAPDWMIDSIVESGVHYLLRETRRASVDFISHSVAMAFEAGIESEHPDAALCVVRVDSDPRRAVLVADGSVRCRVVRGVTADGAAPVLESGPPAASLGEALEWLGLSRFVLGERVR